MPDNCKNFVETLVLVRKGLKDKEVGSTPSLERPPGPHVLEVTQSLQDMLDTGAVNNRAELARRMGVSRPRVTQLLNLLTLVQYLEVGGVVGTWVLLCRYTALKTSHRLTWWRTLIATLLPYALLWLLIALAAGLGVAVFSIAGRSVR